MSRPTSRSTREHADASRRLARQADPQGVRRHHRARRRGLRGPAGRGRGPAGRERRREVDAGLDHRGQQRADVRVDDLGRCRLRPGRPARGHGARDRDDPPGAAAAPDLSVAENVMVGRWPVRGGRVDHREMERVAREQLARLGFEGSLGTPVRRLSAAAQQQVEIAKALSQDASLVILDEPTAALGDAETQALFECIRDLKAEGVGFVYVSHRMAEIAQIADRIVVLRDGQQVAQHDDAQVSPDVLVQEMVGRSVERLYPDLLPPRDEVVLRVQGLTSAEGRFADVSFEVRAGEVFGIAGIVGAGRTELVRSIFGADPLSEGTVEVDGAPLRLTGPADAIRAGLVLVPEDRKSQGVIVPFTVADNLLLPNLKELAPSGNLAPGKAGRLAQEMSERAGVKGGAKALVSALSGGNQQKVVLAKWLERQPRVVMLDEPTRGIDVGARAGIYETVSDLAAAGSAVVVVSSDLEEVLGLAHRVLVMADGRVRGVLERDRADAESVMSLATTS
nr:sugar ABC transporter ATP-binding protein [Barrientosiimonas endolithica]